MMKPLLHNNEFQLDEILFRGKNQAYGAYNLRAEADKFLTKAMFVGVFFVGMVAITPLVINLFKETPTVVEKPYVPPIVLTIPPDTEVVPPKATEAIQPQVQKVKTVDTSVPTPTRKSIKENAPATMDERKDAVSGTESIDAPPAISTYVPPVVAPIGPTTTVSSTVDDPKPAVDNTPLTKVDVEANFQGGIEAFRSKVMKSFSTSDFEDVGGKMSTVVTFIVERDGSISAVQAKGANADFNKEAERTIKKIKGSWVPAQVKGQPVRSYFRFPISMLFE